MSNLNSFFPVWFFKLAFPDGSSYNASINNAGYKADLAELKRNFPAPTDFDSYLRVHGWAKPAGSASAVESRAPTSFLLISMQTVRKE